jgi:hypothetical protein
MKTTVEVPDDLLIEAKKHAAEHRTTLRALIENGLRHELGERTRLPNRQRPAIRWVTVPGGLPKDLDVADRAKMMRRLMK